jgi:KaiB-like protein
LKALEAREQRQVQFDFIPTGYALSFGADDLDGRVRQRLEKRNGGRRRSTRQPDAKSPRHHDASGDGSGNGDDPCPEPIELILYTSAHSPRSAAAIENIKSILSQYGSDKVKLTIYDLAREPNKGTEDSIAFTPTLVKRSPGPRTFILGHLSNPQLLIDLLESCDE